jgi:hypothetical protein
MFMGLSVPPTSEPVLKPIVSNQLSPAAAAATAKADHNHCDAQKLAVRTLKVIDKVQ